MTLTHALDLLTARSSLELSVRDSIYCYGMSKMTCAEENAPGKLNDHYSKLEFVEFLEMVGRIAEVKFRGTEMEELTLHKKLEYTLDDLFTACPGCKRKSAFVEE